MAPQRVWFKKLSKYTNGIGVSEILGSIAFCTVLVIQLGASSTVASGSLGVKGLSSEVESLAIAVLDSNKLYQSDPDCKYPPCD